MTSPEDPPPPARPPMSPERWRVVERVLDGALDVASSDRFAFVAQACGADAELRREVERLLRACERGEEDAADAECAHTSDDAAGARRHLLSRPAAEFAAPVLAAAADRAARATAGHAADRSDVPATLRAALAERYAMERELGRGGMAVVYLARDVRHRRAVALKVVRPVLAEALGPSLGRSLGAQRFLREVAVAARLAHPHILPLFDSGEAAGLLYYVMPYVEGESLRQRLRRDGALPVAVVVRLLGQVARALSHAHRHGVVHRDIKPENILLTKDGDALVADFGVATALAAAATATTTNDADDEALTATGSALGTPAYMAPEQAAAHPHTDHRADLYALGVVAYEMLTGAHPFPGRSAPALLVAHATEVPEAVTMRRAGVPPALASLVMRLLEKRPAGRPQRAEEIAIALDALPTSGAREPPSEPLTERGAARGAGAAGVARPGLTRRGFTWRRTALGGAVAVSLFALPVASWLRARALDVEPAASLRGAGVLADRERILLTDFRGPPSDTLLGAVMTEALRTDLGQSPALRVASRDAIQRALRQMLRSPATPLDLSMAREVAVREGIKAVLDGEIVGVGAGYVLTARLVSADSGETLAAFREPAASADAIIPALDRLSKRLRAKVGESLKSVRASPPLAQVTTASLPALRKYVQGERVWLRDGDQSKGIALLEEALALDSGFASAYATLGALLSSQGFEVARQFAMLQKAFDLRDHLPEAERYRVMGLYHRVGPAPDARKAAAAYEALLELRPDAAYALNELGVLHRNSFRDPAGSERYFASALALDSSAAGFYANLAWSQLDQGKMAEARATIERFGAHLPTHPSYSDIRYWAAFSAGNYDAAASAAAELGAANRLTSTLYLGVAAVTRGKIAEAKRRIGEAAAASRERGLTGTAMVVESYAAYLDIRFLGRYAAGAAALDALVARHILDSLPPEDRPYTNLASWYAEAGRPDRARAMLRRMEADRDAMAAPLSAAARARAMGEIAFAERRYGEALAWFRAHAGARGDDSDRGSCAICPLPHTARAYDAAGNADSAIAVYERYLRTPSAWRGSVEADQFYLAGVLERLGELYEARGERQQAAAVYTRFIALWTGADRELQPRVAEARRRLARLRNTEERR